MLLVCVVVCWCVVSVCCVLLCFCVVGVFVLLCVPDEGGRQQTAESVSLDLSQSLLRGSCVISEWNGPFLAERGFSLIPSPL